MTAGELLGDPMEKAALAAAGWAYAGDGVCVCRLPGRRGLARIVTRYPFSSALKRSAAAVLVEALDGAPPPPEATHGRAAAAYVLLKVT